MHLRHSLVRIPLFAALLALSVRADVVETRSGARLTGTLAKVEGTSVVIDTDYAGTITVKKAEVASLSTDGPVSVRLEDGTRLTGRITGSTGGALRVDVAGTAINTSVDRVAATWAAGAEDPLTAATWSYSATADVTGRTGNSEQLGTAAALEARRKWASESLTLGAAYDRQRSDGAISADKFRAGADYQNNFSGRTSWYARAEGGFDRVKDIDLYNFVGVGFGYDVIQKPKQTLTTRAGLSFRFESYRNPATPEVKGMGLDLGLNHVLELDNSRLVNRVTWLPTLEDFATYRLTHESFFEVPLADPFWKLRVGVANDYNSQPSPGIEKLDTSYFTRLVLTWK